MTLIPQYNSTKNDHPFGMLMPGRSYSSTAYKYGFNGKEKDDEVKGGGNSLDFGARVYDSRIGRWLSTDPRESEYAWQSPYAYYKNSPISILDIMGMGGNDNPKQMNEGGGGKDYSKVDKTMMGAAIGIELKDMKITFANKYTDDGKYEYSNITFSDVNGKQIGTLMEVNSSFLKTRGEESNTTILSVNDIEYLSRDKIEGGYSKLIPPLLNGWSPLVKPSGSNGDLFNAILISIDTRMAFEDVKSVSEFDRKNYFFSMTDFIKKYTDRNSVLIGSKRGVANIPNERQKIKDSLIYDFGRKIGISKEDVEFYNAENFGSQF